MPSGPRARTHHTRPCISHTAKRPGHCPHCAGLRLTRKGTRAKKLEVVQLWQCLTCSRVFTPAPAELRNKTYPLRLILDGVPNATRCRPVEVHSAACEIRILKDGRLIAVHPVLEGRGQRRIAAGHRSVEVW
jgi:hypothetical protein